MARPIGVILLVIKGHRPGGAIKLEQAPVAQADAVGIAGEVGQHLLGSGEGRLL